MATARSRVRSRRQNNSATRRPNSPPTINPVQTIADEYRVLEAQLGTLRAPDLTTESRRHGSVLSREVPRAASYYANMGRRDVMSRTRRAVEEQFRIGKDVHTLPTLMPYLRGTEDANGKVHRAWELMMTEDVYQDSHAAWFQLHMMLRQAIPYLTKYMRYLDATRSGTHLQLQPRARNIQNIRAWLLNELSYIESLEP